MIQLNQKIINNKNGDCFGACIGSILEIEDYPNFHTDGDGDWLTKWNKWLKQYNLGIFYAAFGSISLPHGYSIISVVSSLYPGLTHAIVRYTDGENERIQWNPNPLDKRGNNVPVSDYKLIYVLYSLNPKIL